MFNFGAFAGGLATAIQTQQKLNLEEDKYNAEIENAKAKLKLEGEKLQSEISKKENDRKVKDANIVKEVENIMASDKIDIDAKVKSANNIYRAGGYSMAKVIMTDPTSGEKFVADVTQNLFPEIDKIQKDLDIYKNEGNYKLDNTGALYTRPNAESEFTPIGFKGTNAKAFSKEGIDYTKGLELFTPSGDSVKVYSPNEAKQYEQQGFGRVKPKIDSSPKVEVKIQQAQQDYSEAFDLGTKVIGGDKSIPLKDLAVAQSKVLSSDYGKTESVKNLEKDSAGLHKNLMSLKTLKKDIDAIADDPAFENQYKTAFNEIITKYIPENFYELSPSDKEATYQSLRAKGKMGDALAQYLKSNSGTAASEKEAIRNLTNMFGGENISLMSPKSIRNSLSGFIDTRIESAKVLAQDASDSGLPLNAKKLKDVIDTHTPSGTKKVEVSKDIQDLLKSNNVPYEPEKYEYNIIDGKLKRRLINGK